MHVVGALPPTPTFVTNYAIYPFVGVIEAGFAVAQRTEVDEVLELPLEELRAGYGERRLRGAGSRSARRRTRRRPPHLGATARILGELLSRVR